MNVENITENCPLLKKSSITTFTRYGFVSSKISIMIDRIDTIVIVFKCGFAIFRHLSNVLFFIIDMSASTRGNNY